MRNEIYQRELKGFQLVSMSMQVFASIFRSFLQVLLFIFLPISLLESVILQRMAQTQLSMVHLDISMAPDEATVKYALDTLMHMMTQEFLLYAVAMFLQPVGAIAVAKMAKQYIDGEKVEGGKAIGEALNHMPAILITGFIYGALVLLGSFIIVPGVYFGIAWGLYACVIAFEDKSGWEALRRSKELVQGRWWKTLGYLFLLACIGMLWNTAFGAVCSIMGDTLQADLFYQFLCYIAVGFSAVGECLLYLNRKAVADGACVFGTGFVDDFTSAEDIPAEPVEGTVDGVAEEKMEETAALLEEKTEENENK
ncbi:MAG: hypothetical protein IKT73_03130 [Anaerotignum sp.]|nr:hypothetical protein [Anaerotignum sp.]